MCFFKAPLQPFLILSYPKLIYVAISKVRQYNFYEALAPPGLTCQASILLLNLTLEMVAIIVVVLLKLF